MRRHATLALLATLAVGSTAGLAACGSSSDSGTGTGITTQAAGGASGSATSASPDGALELEVASSDLGDIVVDAEGRTLYVFTADAGTTTACTGACTTTWPALVGDVSAGPGISGALTTAEQSDGTAQVALNGHLLYYYAGDDAPGATSGQGIGDQWYVVDGEGNAITTTAASRSGY